MPPVQQRGVMLIEALIAVLIFALGILGMIAMAGAAVSAQSDARYRTEASALADAIASRIALNVTRSATDPTALRTSLNAFAHHPQDDGYCEFSGDEAGNDTIKGLLRRAGNDPTAGTGLPGATTANQQILVQNADGQFNRVTITLCWKTAADRDWRRHSLVTYVN